MGVSVPAKEPCTDQAANIRACLERELQRLQSFKAEVLLQLQRVKLHYEVEIAKTIEKLSESIDEETAKLQEVLETWLAGDIRECLSLSSLLHAVETEQPLLSLSLAFKPADVSALLRGSLAISVHWLEKEAQSMCLYKFFGGTNAVAYFDVEKEICTKQVTVGTRFFHNSSWCQAPSGEIVLTGGSLTGQSRQSALSFHPVTASMQVLPSMLTARRSHASVYLNGYCYVFGGILGEERLSLCERLELKQGTWTDLNRMHERRAYLAACAWGDMVVLCGGADTSSYEIFSTQDFTYRLTPVTQVNLADVASAVAWESSIVIFHGSMTGQVSRLSLHSGQLVHENNLCYGSSWSNCAPLLFRDIVYLLRADSIFKYNLTTGSSAYVMRLPKAGKCYE